MYADGLIGNRGILEVLGTLTAGQFNKMLPKGKSPYKLEDIINRSFDYLYPPLSDAEKKELANQRLLTFLMTKPDIPKELLESK